MLWFVYYPDKVFRSFTNYMKYYLKVILCSLQIPLGIIFKNENLNEDMVSILQQFFSYLPKTGDGGVDGQLFSGDQLTVERAVNVIFSVANGFTPRGSFGRH